jgi:hypothetical protein
LLQLLHEEQTTATESVQVLRYDKAICSLQERSNMETARIHHEEMNTPEEEEKVLDALIALTDLFPPKYKHQVFDDLQDLIEPTQ